MIEVYALKHMADPLRREPRNVGVIVRRDGRIASRFLGENADGAVNGRSVHVPSDIYQRWVDYYREQLRNKEDHAIERLRSKRPLEFYLDRVASDHQDESLDEALDRMFPQVVSVRATGSDADQFTERIDAIFAAVGVSPDRDIEVVGRVEGENYPCEFEYQVQGSELWLMDKIALPASNLRSARRNANDFAFRAHAVSAASEKQRLAAFVDTSRRPADVDEVLMAVEKYASVVDIADERAAIDNVSEMLRL